LEFSGLQETADGEASWRQVWGRNADLEARDPLAAWRA
jgi:hypothetical protein